MARSSKLNFNERIIAKRRFETPASQRSRIIGELIKFSAAERLDLVARLAGHPELPRDFFPIYPNGLSFHEGVRIGSHLSDESYLNWFLIVVDRHSDLLADFCRKRRKIASAVLRGDGADAIALLKETRAVSESWWAIEMELHISKEVLGNDVRQDIKNLPERFPHMNLEGFVKDLLILSESSAPTLYISAVQSRLREYRSSQVPGAAEMADVESLLMLPAYYDHERSPGIGALASNSLWSIFDQYLLLQKIVQYLYGNNNISDGLKGSISKLAKKIGDWEMLNCLGLDGGRKEWIEYVDSTVLSYTHGDYERVVESIANEVQCGSPVVWGLAEIYARSVIYSGSSFNGTIFDRVSSAFAKILTLDPKSADAKDELENILIKFKSEEWARSALLHLHAICPVPFDEGPIKALRQEVSFLGEMNTKKARFGSIALPDIGGVDLERIPDYRLAKHRLSDCPVVQEVSFPIVSDRLIYKSQSLIASGDISGAITFCIEEWMSDRLKCAFLPIHYLACEISRSGMSGEYEFLPSIILLDLCSREVGVDFSDDKNSLFLDFVYSFDDFLPSQIFKGRGISILEEIFLRQICVPSQLDNIVEIRTVDEVVHERVSIIDTLLVSKEHGVQDLIEERDRVLETLFAEKLRAKIEGGKLYVDVQALRARRGKLYESMFAQAKGLGDRLMLEAIDDAEVNDSPDLLKLSSSPDNQGRSDAVIVALASSERLNILWKIFTQAAADFSMNSDYGLDKYLSAEVRHVVFNSHLRACFERRGLVTTASGGVYGSNTYWCSKYSYVSPTIVADVDRALGRFSKRLDEVLDSVNVRFRVDTEAAPSSLGIFDFRPHHKRLVELSRIIIERDDFESFFTSLMDLMWQITAEGSSIAQSVINDELVPAIESAIDELERDISDSKVDVAMIELMNEIRSSRSDFKNEVEEVLNWFRSPAGDHEDSYERLVTVLDAAVSAFQSTFQHKGRVLNDDFDKSNVYLSYVEAKCLFISMFTALENSLRYGKPSGKVLLGSSSSYGSTQILVRNEVDELDSESAAALELRVKSRWSDEYSSLSSREGGTGVYKIFNLLKVSDGFSVDIDVHACEFTLAIEVVHEHFVSGR